MSAQQQILTIILSRDLFDKLKPFLSRETLEINTVTNGKASLVLLHNLPFDLVVLEHPLPDMELEELLGDIRSAESRSVEAPVLVLTREDPATLAADFDDPLTTFHSLGASADELLMLTANQLGVAARRASRLFVQIKVELGAAQILRACQSVNISESGLLLRSERPLPLETVVDLKFRLPHSTRDIRSTGRVVRYTNHDAEGFVGLAIHFDSITDEDRAAISGFIADRTASRPSTSAAG